MINDLPERITSPAALYSDDFCFWECGSDITLLNQLCQCSLFKVCNWCEECGFKISSTKSAAVLFTRKHNPAPISLILRDGTHLQMKNEYKYLGLTFQRNGSYSKHVQNVAAKCRARLNVIRMLKGTSWVAGKRYLLTVAQEARGAHFPGRQFTIHYGGGAESLRGRRITAGGAEKSQQCHKYILQYSKCAFERTQIWP